MPGAPNNASLLVVAMPFAPSSDARMHGQECAGYVNVTGCPGSVAIIPFVHGKGCRRSLRKPCDELSWFVESWVY